MGTPSNKNIIEKGQCTNPKMKSNCDNNLQSLENDWQDPELLEDISAVTGVELKMEKRRGKGRGKNTKKPKHEGLSNITELQNTPRTRLEKKVFSRSSMKRVAGKMNVIDSKKFKDKFADQFNYT